jgi:hypothetical protein
VIDERIFLVDDFWGKKVLKIGSIIDFIIGSKRSRGSVGISVFKIFDMSDMFTYKHVFSGKKCVVGVGFAKGGISVDLSAICDDRHDTVCFHSEDGVFYFDVNEVEGGVPCSLEGSCIVLRYGLIPPGKYYAFVCNGGFVLVPKDSSSFAFMTCGVTVNKFDITNIYKDTVFSDGGRDVVRFIHEFPPNGLFSIRKVTHG